MFDQSTWRKLTLEGIGVNRGLITTSLCRGHITYLLEMSGPSWCRTSRACSPHRFDVRRSH